MSISMSNIAAVTPEVLAVGGGGTTMNGVLLTENAFAPLGALLTFTGNGPALAAQVGAYFGLSSTEYQAALAYSTSISGMTQTPTTLLMMGYNAADASAWLRGASLTNLTLSQLQAITGTLLVTVDGTVETSASFNLSAATSFANAATIILAAFTSPNFALAFDAQHAAYTVTSNTTGAASSVSFATGTAAVALGLASTSGGVQSLGAVALTPATAMAQLVALTKNFACYTTAWEPVIADKEAFSLFASQSNSTYAYAGYDSDANALVGGNTTTWLAAILAAGSAGTIPTWGAASGGNGAGLLTAMMVMGWAASLNFAQTNGRVELAFRTQTGLVPAVTTDAAFGALQQNGYNFFGQFATSNQVDQFYYGGNVTGPFAWASSYINQIWMNSNIQSALATLLQTAGSIPYNAAGYALIEETLAGGQGATGGPIQQALNFGAIRTGVALSSSQIAALLAAIGSDVSNQIAAQGYYLQILPAPPSARTTRTSPPMTLWYTDGGSIQQLNIASIELP